MKNVRLALSAIVLVFLCVGYAASQIAAYKTATTGDPSAAVEYAQKIDCPPVMWASFAILVVCIVFAFMRDREANET